LKHSFLDKYSDLDSAVHRIDARVKALCALGMIAAVVTTPVERVLPFAAYFAILASVFLLSGIPLRHILARLLIVAPFILLFAVIAPFVPHYSGEAGHRVGVLGLRYYPSGITMLISVTAKAMGGVLCIVALTSTTPFSELLRALERLRVPKFFLALLSFAYRYLFIFIDEFERMKRARDARSFGGKRWWHMQVLGRMVGTMFLRSFERGERVYGAMAARGFDGAFRSIRPLRIDAGDAATGAAFAALVAAAWLAL
jgi:cobalt/nickel transport system permease protein